MQKLFNKGYRMYSPPQNLIYHLWEREYRPTFAKDNQGNTEVGKRHKQCIQILRDTVLADQGFLEEMKTGCGVDLEQKLASEFAECGGLESTFFK